MSTSRNAKIQIETGQTPSGAMAAMTDSDDHKVFTVASGGDIWSGKSGSEPDIRPSGIVTGRNLLSTSTTNDEANIAAFTAYSKGVLKTVAATAATLSRPSTAGKAMIHSYTMASDGSISVLPGVISADTTFSETRGAAGGPPLIPVNSIELGQVRTTASTAAPITAAEINQVIGTHTERYDFPGWDEFNLGKGNKADTGPEENAHIRFANALPLIHTGTVAKAVWQTHNVPIFSDLARAVDFVPADNAHSVSSEEYYGAGSGNVGTIASTSSSLNQGSFVALVGDNITDAIIGGRDNVVTVKFFPDADKTPFILTQGTLGVERSFPTSGQNKATCTISAETESVDFNA